MNIIDFYEMPKKEQTIFISKFTKEINQRWDDMGFDKPEQDVINEEISKEIKHNNFTENHGEYFYFKLNKIK